MAAARTLLEATSWIDRWLYADKSLAIWDITERAKVKCLFVVDDRTQLLMAKTASTIWANALLFCHDAVLEVKDNINFESFMELCNAPLSSSTELFPCGALERAVEKSSWVLHDDAVLKVVTT